MTQLSSRRVLAALTAVVPLVLAVALAAPPGAGASAHKHRARRGAVVKVVRSKKFGKILVDSSGKTLYVLEGPKQSTSACTSTCTGVWPPLMTRGKPRAGKGTAKHKLGTARRGALRQVTYDGHPLYLYAGDTGAGQVSGEGIASFGGTWYVLSGKGAPVKAALASSTSGGGSSSGGSSGGGW